MSIHSDRSNPLKHVPSSTYTNMVGRKLRSYILLRVLRGDFGPTNQLSLTINDINDSWVKMEFNIFKENPMLQDYFVEREFIFWTELYGNH
jgi:hypothetical protein